MSSSSFSRAGAMDLSKLAQKAQQPTPSSPSSPGAGSRGTGGSYVIDATEQTFEQLAIQSSLKHPVVIEFYSPRAQDWETLSNALTTLAAESDGKFLLVRLNVDAAPQIVQMIGLQAVPTVVAAIGGQLAPLFQGVQPLDQVRIAVDQVLKAAVANGIVGRAEPVGGAVDEEVEDGPDPRFAAADAALEQGDFAAAEAEFDRLLTQNPNDLEAKAGKAQTGLLARVSLLDPQVVRAAVSADGAPLQAQLDAADLELATGQADAAFDRLIELVKATSGDERNQVRVRVLELFETLGNTDPRVLKARSALMTALF